MAARLNAFAAQIVYANGLGADRPQPAPAGKKQKRIWEDLKSGRCKGKGRTPGLPGGDHAEPPWGQMEGPHSPGPDARNQTIWRAEEIRGKRIPEGPDGPAAGHGGKRSGPQGGLCRGPAKGGILPDGAWKEPEAHFGFHVGLGRRV